MTMVNLREASQITGISTATLKKHIGMGILEAEQKHKGCSYRINITELEEYAFYVWMNRRQLNGLRMFNPFEDFYNLKLIVLGDRLKR